MKYATTLFYFDNIKLSLAGGFPAEPTYVLPDKTNIKFDFKS